MDLETLEKLDEARRRANVPFRLTSAMRCEKHNRETPGASEQSAHLTGHAVDIRAESSHMRFQILFGLVGAGFNRIGIYKDSIHADCDPTKIPRVMWMGG